MTTPDSTTRTEGISLAEIEGGQGAGAKRRNLRFEIAQELFDGIPEIAEDITARPDGRDAVDFVTALVESPTPEEAITVTAYNLPRRFAVWWGHECLMRLENMLEDADKHMIGLAAAWVGDPSEDNRYAAMNQAMEAKVKSPGVWIAFAAGWSGGSMVGPEMPAVPPAPHLTAKAVNAGVLSILARVTRDERPKMLGSFVRMGIQLAEQE